MKLQQAEHSINLKKNATILLFPLVLTVAVLEDKTFSLFPILKYTKQSSLLFLFFAASLKNRAYLYISFILLFSLKLNQCLRDGTEACDLPCSNFQQW